LFATNAGWLLWLLGREVKKSRRRLSYRTA
jgi:hypothetical protein